MKELKKERWKPIAKYEELYHVSSLGNVKALCVEKYRGRFKHKQPEKILRLKKHRDGYLCVTLCKDKARRTYQVHRLVASAFVKNPKKKLFVNHKNGIKNCNLYYNLEWVTSSQNIIHAINTGLYKPSSGESSSTSKLKGFQVKKIYKSKESDTVLSRRYKISRAQIFRIKKGLRWSELTKNIKHEKIR